LSDPQSLNSYSYANDNPITRSDRSGLYSIFDNPSPQAMQYWSQLNDAAFIMGQNPGWNFAFNHPYTTGALVAVGSYPALATGGSASEALSKATWPGVSGTFAAQQGIASLIYGALTVDTTLSVPDFVNTLRQFDPKQPTTFFSVAWAVASGPAAAAAGGRVG